MDRAAANERRLPPIPNLAGDSWVPAKTVNGFRAVFVMVDRDGRTAKTGNVFSPRTRVRQGKSTISNVSQWRRLSRGCNRLSLPGFVVV